MAFESKTRLGSRPFVFSCALPNIQTLSDVPENRLRPFRPHHPRREPSWPSLRPLDALARPSIEKTRPLPEFQSRRRRYGRGEPKGLSPPAARCDYLSTPSLRGAFGHARAPNQTQSRLGGGGSVANSAATR